MTFESFEVEGCLFIIKKSNIVIGHIFNVFVTADAFITLEQGYDVTRLKNVNCESLIRYT